MNVVSLLLGLVSWCFIFVWLLWLDVAHSFLTSVLKPFLWNVDLTQVRRPKVGKAGFGYLCALGLSRLLQGVCTTFFLLALAYGISVGVRPVAVDGDNVFLDALNECGLSWVGVALSGLLFGVSEIGGQIRMASVNECTETKLGVLLALSFTWGLIVYALFFTDTLVAFAFHARRVIRKAFFQCNKMCRCCRAGSCCFCEDREEDPRIAAALAESLVALLLAVCSFLPLFPTRLVRWFMGGDEVRASVSAVSDGCQVPILGSGDPRGPPDGGVIFFICIPLVAVVTVITLCGIFFAATGGQYWVNIFIGGGDTVEVGKALNESEQPCLDRLQVALWRLAGCLALPLSVVMALFSDVGLWLLVRVLSLWGTLAERRVRVHKNKTLKPGGAEDKSDQPQVSRVRVFAPVTGVRGGSAEGTGNEKEEREERGSGSASAEPVFVAGPLVSTSLSALPPPLPPRPFSEGTEADGPVWDVEEGQGREGDGEGQQGQAEQEGAQENLWRSWTEEGGGGDGRSETAAVEGAEAGGGFQQFPSDGSPAMFPGGAHPPENGRGEDSPSALAWPVADGQEAADTRERGVIEDGAGVFGRDEMETGANEHAEWQAEGEDWEEQEGFAPVDTEAAAGAVGDASPVWETEGTHAMPPPSGSNSDVWKGAGGVEGGDEWGEWGSDDGEGDDDGWLDEAQGGKQADGAALFPSTPPETSPVTRGASKKRSAPAPLVLYGEGGVENGEALGEVESSLSLLVAGSLDEDATKGPFPLSPCSPGKMYHSPPLAPIKEGDFEGLPAAALDGGLEEHESMGQATKAQRFLFGDLEEGGEGGGERRGTGLAVEDRKDKEKFSKKASRVGAFSFRAFSMRGSLASRGGKRVRRSSLSVVRDSFHVSRKKTAHHSRKELCGQGGRLAEEVLHHAGAAVVLLECDVPPLNGRTNNYVEEAFALRGRRDGLLWGLLPFLQPVATLSACAHFAPFSLPKNANEVLRRPDAHRQIDFWCSLCCFPPLMAAAIAPSVACIWSAVAVCLLVHTILCPAQDIVNAADDRRASQHLPEKAGPPLAGMDDLPLGRESVVDPHGNPELGLGLRQVGTAGSIGVGGLFLDPVNVEDLNGRSVGSQGDSEGVGDEPVVVERDEVDALRLKLRAAAAEESDRLETRRGSRVSDGGGGGGSSGIGLGWAESSQKKEEERLIKKLTELGQRNAISDFVSLMRDCIDRWPVQKFGLEALACFPDPALAAAAGSLKAVGEVVKRYGTEKEAAVLCSQVLLSSCREADEQDIQASRACLSCLALMEPHLPSGLILQTLLLVLCAYCGEPLALSELEEEERKGEQGEAVERGEKEEGLRRHTLASLHAADAARVMEAAGSFHPGNASLRLRAERLTVLVEREGASACRHLEEAEGVHPSGRGATFARRQSAEMGLVTPSRTGEGTESRGEGLPGREESSYAESQDAPPSASAFSHWPTPDETQDQPPPSAPVTNENEGFSWHEDDQGHTNQAEQAPDPASTHGGYDTGEGAFDYPEEDAEAGGETTFHSTERADGGLYDNEGDREGGPYEDMYDAGEEEQAPSFPAPTPSPFAETSHANETGGHVDAGYTAAWDDPGLHAETGGAGEQPVVAGPPIFITPAGEEGERRGSVRWSPPSG
uniref:Uncharacterized protein n=1 Tax=Chromera velia CCMP2878 TaxID=1169474 RepID=A0A0G4HVP4_9ALVE|eukprot:Cvel_8872.t1-p1 / transcript=Cvel_8872.t1 / gene=Cvel_8872 / organism=Chromera_velia_CCMP2878 / gene_product=hypothetical protein / transcript_product=hypothetical protein / location=Cvel_scaffold499:20694-26823(-) / protein_length=1634 / sequence_SO=supercontig / SO=protein_coding / is_pseudo=false